MDKFLKTVIIGAASGAAAAYFLSTEKGKEFKAKLTKAYQAYKQEPEHYQQTAKEKAAEYSQLAVDTFNDYKEKWQTGELTKDDLLSAAKEKAGQAAQFANEKVNEVKKKYYADDPSDAAAEDVTAEVDDIIIDYPETDDEADFSDTEQNQSETEEKQ
ncbi:YtxH domain-containing protein [Streptococcus pantholopis]|uniref:Gas vesicle protein n=1 Tax=Streptococcus pantholopis TaxID=1811193 RepID=A0A172Q676_9STRE|nr:YtxH domain-containing protein [Streptococcus pantholopis]AND78993.1 gas vesicle protein [Streptococcus pantholopis]